MGAYAPGYRRKLMRFRRYTNCLDTAEEPRFIYSQVKNKTTQFWANKPDKGMDGIASASVAAGLVGLRPLQPCRAAATLASAAQGQSHDKS
jgi:hypothetical protein